MKTLTGVVVSGKGQARAFTQLPWLRAYFLDKFGFEPYPGTLNVRVQDVALAADIRNGPAYSIESENPGYCAARAFKVMVEGRVPAIWIVPMVSGYPDDQVELMSEGKLRMLLDFKDGDVISIQVPDGEP